MLIFGVLPPTGGHLGSVMCVHKEKWFLSVSVSLPLCVCVFLLVWEIKLNLKSAIMVVWKEGRERVLILQADEDFFPSQLPLGDYHAPDLEVSSAVQLEASSVMAV